MLLIFNLDIRHKILNLISDAQQEIVAAIAWFTDIAVYNELIKAIMRGVQLKMVTLDDDINHNAPFDLGELAKLGAQIWLWDRETLGTMHHKFMVVDKKVVVMGSYNWTVSAAGFNRESVVVFDGADSPAKDYLLEFESLCQQARLHPLSKPVTSRELILSDIKAKLRIQIRELEIELAELEAQKTETESIIEEFTHALRLRLGPLFLLRLELETRLARLIAQKSKKRSDQEEFEEKQQYFHQFSGEYENSKEKKTPKLAEEDENDLKKMYREAIMSIHPDRFNDDPEKLAKANEITARLTEAYKNKDIQTVREVWQAIKEGTIFGLDIGVIDNEEILKRILDKLILRKNSLLLTIQSLKKNEFYGLGLKKQEWESYFESTKNQLNSNIEQLKKSIDETVVAHNL